MATDVLFLRHGEAALNRAGALRGHRDVPLTQWGHQMSSRASSRSPATGQSLQCIPTRLNHDHHDSGTSEWLFPAKAITPLAIGSAALGRRVPRVELDRIGGMVSDG